MNRDSPSDSAPLQPVILVLDEHEGDLRRIEADLVRRFGSSYTIVATTYRTDALAQIQQLASNGQRIAVLIAAAKLSDASGVDFLQEARLHEPGAMRVLLFDMDRRGTRIPLDDLPILQRATALGQIEYSVLKGWTSPEEWFYSTVQDALTNWTRQSLPHHEVFRVVGDQWSARSHELRDGLSRNTVPFGFYASDSPAGQALMAQHGIRNEELPAVVLHDGSYLDNPTFVEIAEALGVKTRPEAVTYDVAIVGAGPAGLAAAVYAASEGLSAIVVESESIGGQAGTSSFIRNYLGFPRGVSGGDLTFRAWEQALLFGANFVFIHRAVGLERNDDHLSLRLSSGDVVQANTVMLATGVQYRRLGIPALERLVGCGVYYGAATAEAPAFTGEDVFVVGGANSAGQAALHLAKFARSVTLLVRGNDLAAGMSDYLITQIKAAPNVSVRLNAVVVEGRGTDRLQAISIQDRVSGETQELPAAGLFVLIGAEPRTEWLADAVERDAGNFILTGDQVPAGVWPLQRRPLPFETSMPGVFAVGDVRQGSTKRVAGAVGEGSVAIGSVHRYLALEAANE